MRIISGKYRGRKLISPINNDVRPTSDMTKEAIFSSIQFDILSSSFLDLFSGSGSIGLEALSRGADKVVFVDSSRDSINLIKENTKFAKEENKIQILNRDYKDAIISLKNNVFDFIFLDPPYNFENINEILNLLKDYSLIDSSSLIIYEKKYLFRPEIEDSFEIIKTKKYSKTEVIYLRLKDVR